MGIIGMGCVCIVLFILLTALTGMFGWFISWLHDDNDALPYIAWFASAFGFAVCLTAILFQNGWLV